MSADLSGWLTPAQAAEALGGISTRTVRRLLRRGDLSYVKTGEARQSRVRIDPESVDDYVRRRAKRATAKADEPKHRRLDTAAVLRRIEAAQTELEALRDLVAAGAGT